MLMEIRNLSVTYHGKKHRLIRAVDCVDLSLEHGDCVGIVGESGCGKSSLARAIAGLESNCSGKVFLNGQEILSSNLIKKREFRRRVQMIFQDSSTAQSRQMKMRQYLSEPLQNFGIVPKNQILQESIRLLHAVRLTPEYLFKYPQNISGGERQRCAIARAIAGRPDVLICDEPTSALDVSTQAEIIKLLLNLQQEMRMSYIFISHDLALIQQICTRILIMFRGVVVEEMAVHESESSMHPYTRRLFNASFTLEKAKMRERIKQDDIDDINPAQLAADKGCVYASVCPEARERCLSERPILRQTQSSTHRVACWMTQSEEENKENAVD